MVEYTSNAVNIFISWFVWEWAATTLFQIYVHIFTRSYTTQNTHERCVPLHDSEPTEVFNCIFGFLRTCCVRNPNIPYQETSTISLIIFFILMTLIELNLQYMFIIPRRTYKLLYIFLDVVEACAMNKIFHLIPMLW